MSEPADTGSTTEKSPPPWRDESPRPWPGGGRPVEERRAAFTRIDLLCAFVILCAVLLIGASGITQGGLGWSDAPNHAFDGVFVLEFVKAAASDTHLLTDPTAARGWAEQFYLRHPSIGIVVYWPPGFAVVEAVIFAALGVSVVTARATVLLFAIGSGHLMYVLGRRWFDRPTGLLASLLLITTPHGAFWLNDVMLEWPATFWILAAVWSYQRDQDEPRTRWAVLLAASLVAAFMTKQTAVFIAPVLLVHALLQPGRRAYLLRPALLIPMIAAGLIIGGYQLVASRYAALPSMLLKPEFHALFYACRLPEILGLPLLPIAVLGLVTFLAAPNRRARGLLLLWLLAWTTFCTIITAKEPRYFFFALPPLAFAAVRFFTRPTAAGTERPFTRKFDTPRFVLLAALVVTQAILARTKLPGRLPDYAAVVAEVAAKPDADLVLVDAVRDGQFVFDIYRSPAARDKIIPLRASKLFYARAARMQYGGQVFVETEQDIVGFLDRYGIRYIVIESALPRTPYTDADPPPRKLLRRLLADDSRFVLVKSWPLRCGDPAWDDVELRLYAYPTCPPRQSPEIKLSFPAMGREITFRLPE